LPFYKDGEEMKHKSFDEVWKDIMMVLSNRSFVNTLVQCVRNDLISIEQDHIKLRSEKTRKIRKIPRSQFEEIWNSLTSDGFYISKAHRPYIHNQIICAILYLLDYVRVERDPFTLYLK